jgi:hypothetical protein
MFGLKVCSYRLQLYIYNTSYAQYFFGSTTNQALGDQGINKWWPNDIGASFLHHVYRNIHNEDLDNFENIHDFYHSGLALGALAQADFCWWGEALNSGLREQFQPRDF